MQDNHDKPATSVDTAVAAQTNLARRKAILKGLGKTAVVAGAVAPLSSLAGVHLRYVSGGVNHHCSMSGHMSVMHSAIASSVTECGGKQPGSFAYSGSPTWDGTDVVKANWPNWLSKTNNSGILVAAVRGYDGNLRSPKATFAQVFGSTGVSNGAPKIGFLLSGTPNEDSHWLAALLNAQNDPTLTKFPHTAEQVLSHFNGQNRAQALAFYRDHVNKLV